MTREEIVQKCKEIMFQTDGRMPESVRDCSEDADLRTDLGLSSVGMLYTVIVIEETFGIRFENVGMNDFATLKDVVDYIETHIDRK